MSQSRAERGQAATKGEARAPQSSGRCWAFCRGLRPSWNVSGSKILRSCHFLYLFATEFKVFCRRCLNLKVLTKIIQDIHCRIRSPSGLWFKNTGLGSGFLVWHVIIWLHKVKSSGHLCLLACLAHFLPWCVGLVLFFQFATMSRLDIQFSLSPGTIEHDILVSKRIWNPAKAALAAENRERIRRALTSVHLKVTSQEHPIPTANTFCINF